MNEWSFFYEAVSKDLAIRFAVAVWPWEGRMVGLRPTMRPKIPSESVSKDPWHAIAL
jgi:hypothetical protein